MPVPIEGSDKILSGAHSRRVNLPLVRLLIFLSGLLVGLAINPASAKVSRSDYLLMVKWSDLPQPQERYNTAYQVKITKVSLADRVVWIEFVKPEK